MKRGENDPEPEAVSMNSERFSNLAAHISVPCDQSSGVWSRVCTARVHPFQVNDEISRSAGAIARSFGRICASRDIRRA